MKIRNIFASVLLAGFAAVGLAAGLKEAPVKRVGAEPAKLDTYNIVGTMTSWSTSPEFMYYDSEKPENAAFITDFPIEADQEFLIRPTNGWAGTLDYSKVGGGGAAGYFVHGYDGEGNINIKCKLTASYNIFVTSADSKIYIEFAEEPTVSKAGVYVQVKTWEHTYVYAYDEVTEGKDDKTIKPFGNWPGKEIAVVTDGVDFHYQNGDALGGIGYIEVPYINLANTRIIINNNAGSESGKQPLVAGSYYWNNGNVGDADAGKGAALVMEVAELFKNDASICTLKRSEAQAILDKYNDPSFTENTCQQQFNKTTFYTWADSLKESKANFTGEQVIAELTRLASDKNPNVLLVNNMSNTITTSTVIVIISVTLVIIAVGSVLIIRKRKEN